jgi:hypothetical protein
MSEGADDRRGRGGGGAAGMQFAHAGGPGPEGGGPVDPDDGRVAGWGQKQ